MNPNPSAPDVADYLIPWATIEAETSLTFSAKKALLDILGDDQVNPDTLETTKDKQGTTGATPELRRRACPQGPLEAPYRHDG